ncbi:hypothetical protein V5799_006269 [Amblyomma americanum]|uniref:Myb/SANT-like DNA-binding domain-containing protein 3 n=1 Tax=Amblyomma americanum TaxID=6943 RepID=A0AAQ4DWW1_AMBAM
MEKTEKGKINFSRVERALLLDLVDKHKAVLENKRTDAVSVARKRKEWELIETQFNSSHNVSPRTWLQLKKCWENWKNKWRKAKADDNREIFKTGDAEDPLWSWHYEEGSPQQDEQMEEEPVAMAASLTSATTATAAPSCFLLPLQKAQQVPAALRACIGSRWSSKS